MDTDKKTSAKAYSLKSKESVLAREKFFSDINFSVSKLLYFSVVPNTTENTAVPPPTKLPEAE